jgi:predicted O-methyltransferase YrrM
MQTAKGQHDSPRDIETPQDTGQGRDTLRQEIENVQHRFQRKGLHPEGMTQTVGQKEITMDESLETLLAELEQFGEANDKSISDRPRRMLNITRDTGEFLAVLVRATLARRVLEIGTSNGYSTLWLASAARDISGSVTTVEHSSFKVDLAAKNFARSGLTPFIVQLQEDAGLAFSGQGNAAFDMIFLDAERTEYSGWWPDIKRVLRPGGLLVVDNASSHPEQLAPFFALVRADAGFITCLVPVGNGEFLAALIGR